MTVETGRLSAAGVQEMFDRIAPVYDAMNRAMTVGLDRHWRTETARAVARRQRWSSPAVISRFIAS